MGLVLTRTLLFGDRSGMLFMAQPHGHGGRLMRPENGLADESTQRPFCRTGRTLWSAWHSRVLGEPTTEDLDGCSHM